MEDSFANQPKEAVNTGPELTDITKRLCAVAKQINTVNTVAEAQNQPPVMMAGISGAKISASTLIILCSAF